MKAYIRKLHDDRYHVISGLPENHGHNTTTLGGFPTRRQAVRHADKSGCELVIRGRAPGEKAA